MREKNLSEAISRRRIAIRNAQKQRQRYTQKKGELPPILDKPKSRLKFTKKEVDNLKNIVQKQAEKRKAARDITKQKKHPQVPTTSSVTSIEASKKTSIKAPEPQPLKPAFSKPAPSRWSGPKPMGGDVSDHIGRYAETKDKKHLDAAKRAAMQQYASDMTFAQTEYKTNEFKKRGKAEAKQKYKENLRLIKDVKYPPGSGLLNKVRRIFSEGAGFDSEDEARMKSNLGRKMGQKGTASDEKRFSDVYARWKKMKKKTLKEGRLKDWAIEFEEKHGRKPTNDDLKKNKATNSLKRIGDKLAKDTIEAVKKRQALVAKNKAANPEKYVERPNSPETGLKRPYPRKLREQQLIEKWGRDTLRALGHVTGLSKDQMGGKSSRLSRAGDTLAGVAFNAAATGTVAGALGGPAAGAAGAGLGAAFHTAMTIKDARRSIKNHDATKRWLDKHVTKNKKDQANWEKKHSVAEACSKRVNPKEVLDNAEYKKMKKDKKNPALRKALGKKR